MEHGLHKLCLKATVTIIHEDIRQTTMIYHGKSQSMFSIRFCIDMRKKPSAPLTINTASFQDVLFLNLFNIQAQQEGPWAQQTSEYPAFAFIKNNKIKNKQKINEEKTGVRKRRHKRKENGKRQIK